MKWVRDNTGRFSRRPHYLPGELDSECESLIGGFLQGRYGTAAYPVSTEDLTVLIETLVDDLDLYADLSKEDGEVEGVTDFFQGRRPKVRIAKQLTNDSRMSNRLRTTLTHELGHVKFHTSLFDTPKSGSLFASDTPESNACTRDNILGARQTDWMEWQAGFCCGAFLIPASALATTVRNFRLEFEVQGHLDASSVNGQYLITAIVEQFEVSRDAARIRLLQSNALVDRIVSATLF